MSQTLDEVLAHYGVKGMRWGIRRKRKVGDGEVLVKTNNSGQVVKVKGGEKTPASDDAVKAAVYKQVANKSGTSSLSNAQLRHLVDRIKLEQQFEQVAGTSKGRKRRAGDFVSNLLATAGNQQANRVANLAATVAVNQALARAAAKPGAKDLVKEVAKRAT